MALVTISNISNIMDSPLFQGWKEGGPTASASVFWQGSTVEQIPMATAMVGDTKYVEYVDATFGFAPMPRRKHRAPRTAAVARDKSLAYVNVARQALRREPLDELPTGRVGSVTSCVFARAIGDCRVSTDFIVFATPEMARAVSEVWAVPYDKKLPMCLDMPDAMADFVLHFDQGAYPDLVS